jgi:CHASE3 domain sensor protein
MNINVKANQMLNKGLYDSIMLEGQMALPYLPAEDKVNLALGLVTAQVIGDPSPTNTLRDLTLSLQEKLKEAELTIQSLQQQASVQVAANTNP